MSVFWRGFIHMIGDYKMGPVEYAVGAVIIVYLIMTVLSVAIRKIDYYYSEKERTREKLGMIK